MNRINAEHRNRQITRWRPSVNALTLRRSEQLAGFDVYIWDERYALKQSLRID